MSRTHSEANSLPSDHDPFGRRRNVSEEPELGHPVDWRYPDPLSEVPPSPELFEVFDHVDPKDEDPYPDGPLL